MVAAIWLAVVLAVVVFAWGCMPETIGDSRSDGKASPLKGPASNVGEDHASRH